MKRFFLASLLLVLTSGLVNAAERISATLFKNPGCRCCDEYAVYLRLNGFDVAVVENRNMTLVKKRHGVRPDLEGCHSLIVGDYVIEGHVPAQPIKRLLTEKPAIKGITLPGMPQGSPGMSGEKKGLFEILSITGDLKPAPVYATE